ncbi:phosphonate transporter [Paraburkholderia sp. PREW-6R]|uniref:phosphonate transporter n=1 Tax=Paraburkholderia sp. PREW-6R TaxID=3141544 RepID=UPI0031F55CB9
MNQEAIQTESFGSVSFDQLSAADEGTLDSLTFGVIGFDPAYIVTHYNAVESTSAGLRKAHVIGRHLFEEVAPCMNNFMVAQRFEDESELDQVVPYVLTLRMRPTPVQLRLLKSSRSDTRFLLVERKDGK